MITYFFDSLDQKTEKIVEKHMINWSNFQLALVTSSENTTSFKFGANFDVMQQVFKHYQNLIRADAKPIEDTCHGAIANLYRAIGDSYFNHLPLVNR